MTGQHTTGEKPSASSGVKTKREIGKQIIALDRLLLEAVDETIKYVFREPGAKAIYKYIENNCHMKREEIAKKPEVFSAGLEKLLGSGAPVMQKLILKKLCCKLELKHEEKEGYAFADYIKELAKGCNL